MRGYWWDGAAWQQVPLQPAASNPQTLSASSVTTTTSLAASPTSVKAGSTVTLTATVTGAATGTVEFFHGSTRISTDTAPPWTATHAPTAVGTATYTAKYIANGNYLGSQGSRSVTVTAASTTKTWSGYATSSRSYVGDGTLRYADSASKMYCGTYSATNGNQKGACWFAVPSDVKGSSVTSVALRITQVGGVGSSSSLQLGSHRDSAVEATWGAIGTKDSAVITSSYAYSGSDQERTHTSNLLANELEEGARGFIFESTGYFALYGVDGVASSKKPHLSITYVV